jgi:hypothetical protein
MLFFIFFFKNKKKLNDIKSIACLFSFATTAISKEKKTTSTTN